LAWGQAVRVRQRRKRLEEIPIRQTWKGSRFSRFGGRCPRAGVFVALLGRKKQAIPVAYLSAAGRLLAISSKPHDPLSSAGSPGLAQAGFGVRMFAEGTACCSDREGPDFGAKILPNQRTLLARNHPSLPAFRWASALAKRKPRQATGVRVASIRSRGHEGPGSSSHLTSPTMRHVPQAGTGAAGNPCGNGRNQRRAVFLPNSPINRCLCRWPTPCSPRICVAALRVLLLQVSKTRHRRLFSTPIAAGAPRLKPGFDGRPLRATCLDRPIPLTIAGFNEGRMGEITFPHRGRGLSSFTMPAPGQWILMPYRQEDWKPRSLIPVRGIPLELPAEACCFQKKKCPHDRLPWLLG